MLISIIIVTFLGSIISLFGGLLLLTRKTWSQRLSLLLTSFAAGVLIATAFFDLLPEALVHAEETSSENVFLPVMLAIILFFLLERTLLWFHHHHTSHDLKPTVWMMTIGDGLHNFIDGVAIASTFMVNPALGLTTALAVAAHEIPQEIADFSILLSRGLSRKKAILFNVSSAIAALIGAVITFFIASTVEVYLGTIISFTAGMFIYIALSDLIPELHHNHTRRDTLPHIAAFLIGITAVYFFTSFGFGDAH